MGRYYYDKKGEADKCRQISIFRLEEFLSRPASGRIIWTSDWDNFESSICVRSFFLEEHPVQLSLNYTVTANYDTKKDYDYAIRIIRTHCYFGGYRYWFTCPLTKSGVKCNGRVGKLYYDSGYFGCRKCLDLSYSSRNENRRGAYFYLGYAAFTLPDRIEKARSKLRTKRYKGKPTKRFLRFLRLVDEVSGEQVDEAIERVNKIRNS